MKNGFSYAEFGRKMYDLRMERKLTLARLTDELGCDACMAHNWESGKCAPRIHYLFAICKFYGVSADWLLGLK